MEWINQILCVRVLVPVIIVAIFAGVIIVHYVKQAIHKYRASKKRAIVKKRLESKEHRPVKLTKK